MNAFLNTLHQKIDCFTEHTGKFVSWLVMLLVLLVGYDVFMRYVFQSGSVSLQELEWHLFSVIFLIGGAYTLKHDAHVRLDILYRSHMVSDKQRAWLDVLGTVFILLPFCLLIIFSAGPFLFQSYTHNEVSSDPGGLPARWLIKSTMILGFVLLVIQGLAEFLKKLSIALNKSS